MIVRLFFLFLLAGRVLSEYCTSVNSCGKPYHVCRGNSCEGCNSDTECAGQHVVRRKCIEPENNLYRCAQCTLNSNCSSGQVCVTDDRTYLCVTTCTSPSDTTCPANSQCIYIKKDRGSDGDFYCISCENDSDCKKWSGNSASTCSSGICSPEFASCTQQSHCTSPTLSDCSLTNKRCQPCSQDSHCNHLTATPKCKSGGGRCVECINDSDCQTREKSKCSSNTCSACTEDSHCSKFPTTPFCSNSLGGTCVECVYDPNCSSAVAAQCSSNICVPCTASSQCTHLSSTPICKTSTGSCVECLSDSDCSSTTASKCSLTNNTCVACYQYQNTCYTACPYGTSPNSTDYTCIQNIAASCKSSSDCIAAATDETHPECNGTMCVACSTDVDCQKWYNQLEMTCNNASGACVLVVDPIVETVAVVSSTITTSAVVAVSGAAAISTFASAGSASRGLSTLRITKLAALLRYININTPYEAEKLFESFTKAQTFIKMMLVGLFGEEQYNQTMINLPKRFVKFEDTSLFLKNSGMLVLISTFIGLAIIICRMGIHKVRKMRSRNWMRRFLSLQNILEWNYILGMIMASYPDLILGFGLQVYDLPFSNPTPLSLISFVICVLVTPISIFFPLLCWFLMSAKNKRRNHNNYHNISRYEVFIADFKENNSETKTYQVIGLLRIQAMVFPLIFWQHNPLAQILFLIVGSIAANYFHITKVSYKSRFTNFVILANELLFFVGMIGMLLHISFSSSGINNPKLTSAVGWIIASTLTAIMVFNVIVSLLGLLKYLWTGLKAARNRSKTPKKSIPDIQSIQQLQLSSSVNTSVFNLSQTNKVLINHRANFRSNLHHYPIIRKKVRRRDQK